MLPSIALLYGAPSTPHPHLLTPRSPGKFSNPRSLSPVASLQGTHSRADGTTWWRTRYNSPCEAHHPGAAKEEGTDLAARPSVATSPECANSLRLFPHPPWSCQYLTWRLRPLPLLCVRACVRWRLLRGQVGAARCRFWLFRGRRLRPAVLDGGADEARGS